MTNREKKIEETRQAWGQACLEKEKLIHEIWRIEAQIEALKNLMVKYGVEEFHYLAKEAAELD